LLLSDRGSVGGKVRIGSLKGIDDGFKVIRVFLDSFEVLIKVLEAHLLKLSH
jgi:hypothetical protein